MGRTPIDISEASGIRYLHFGSEWVQGAMRIRRPIDLELEYTREMMIGLLLRPGYQASATWPRRILTIGLGAGSLTKFCYWKLPQAHVTAVEIDPVVWATARQYFKLPPDDKRLEVEIADGVEYMSRENLPFDYILVDGYDPKAEVGLLDSEPFYRNCRARLSDQGVLAANLFGRSRRYALPLERLARAFDGQAGALPPCASGNVIALATKWEPVEIEIAELNRRAATLKRNTGLDLSPCLARLASEGSLENGILRL